MMIATRDLTYKGRRNSQRNRVTIYARYVMKGLGEIKCLLDMVKGEKNG